MKGVFVLVCLSLVFLLLDDAEAGWRLRRIRIRWRRIKERLCPVACPKTCDVIGGVGGRVVCKYVCGRACRSKRDVSSSEENTIPIPSDFSSYDSPGGDGLVSLTEFAQRVGDSEEDLKQAFELADADGSGFLDEGEFLTGPFDLEDNSGEDSASQESNAESDNVSGESSASDEE